jgi:hypothetical protein
MPRVLSFAPEVELTGGSVCEERSPLSCNRSEE